MRQRPSKLVRSLVVSTLVIGSLVAMQACSDSGSVLPVEPDGQGSDSVVSGGPQVIITPNQHPNVPVFPGGPTLRYADLVVSNITWSQTGTSCGPNMLEIQCATQYFFQVTISNIGGEEVPRGVTHLSMSVGGGNLGDLLITKRIPAGGSIVVSYPYFPGPCGATGSCSIVQVGAWVDRLDTVREIDENNNTLIVNACKCQ